MTNSEFRVYYLIVKQRRFGENPRRLFVFLRKGEKTLEERIKEACGVFGIYAPAGEQVANSVYYGLSSL